MRYFTVHGSNSQEALAEMMRRYGPDACIQSHQTVRVGGVLGLFTRPAVEITGYVDGKTDESSESRPQPADGKPNAGARGAAAPSLGALLDQVTALRERLDESLPPGAEVTVQRDEHPALAELRALLAGNDLAAPMRGRLIDAVRSELPLSGLQDQAAVHQFVMRRVAAELAIAVPLQQRPAPADGPRVCTLVGPTGVGKTTTIAKLAALHGLGNGGLAPPVRIVTIDNYRIGAREQIETYGDIMRIPVTSAETVDELKKAIALGSDAEIMFVDTVGRSPTDYARMAEMRSVLDAVGRGGTTQLVVSATTKFADLRQILRQFEPFGYDSVIVTKLDETSSIGNVISALADARKPVSYLCSGQVVPQDIAPASTIRLLLNLHGFRFDRKLLEQEFGERAAPNGRAAPSGTAVEVAGEN
ncbi:MAG: flagellar biosynthesis protein FlhF [Spirochaetaceae bacterium]|nr:flagellar biosynthesis protein FlhF [Spirochaetaceae bacterium]